MNRITVSMKKMVEEIGPHFGISTDFIERSAKSVQNGGNDLTIHIRNDYEVKVPVGSIKEYFDSKPETPAIATVFKAEDFDEAFPKAKKKV